ncbi:hypothetical protein AB833_14590 [Chromatiales bacterium (ex Bugula neritina AB1)]|nr:hypothetical protein AB833_14590 [Chromatiales bacterium (ex Bugula neritina AB1)]
MKLAHGFFITLLALVITMPSYAAITTVVISGLGGNAEYKEQFASYATRIADEARRSAGSPQDVIMVRGDAAKRSIILGLLNNLSKGKPLDTLVVYLIGHGSFDGEIYKFNIPGADITGDEIINALNALKTRRQLIVVATSASGALLEPLARDNRVVITATKNGRERNAVQFPRYLVEALSGRTADTDKNEIISAQEMFAYTDRAVANHYETEKLLASEHPRISGTLAENIEVARYGTLLARKASIPEKLLTQRDDISARINALRLRKDDLNEDDYFDLLEPLMLELSGIQTAIDQAGTTKNAN